MPFDFEHAVHGYSPTPFDKYGYCKELRLKKLDSDIKTSIEKVCYFLKANADINFLSLDWMYLDTNEKDILFLANLSIPSLSVINIDDSAVEVLSKNPHLKQLSIESKFVTRKAWLALAEANLEYILINGVTDEIIEILANNQNIKHMILGSLDRKLITERTWSALAQANLESLTAALLKDVNVNILLTSRTIKSLDISNSTIPQLDPMAFADNLVLESLNMMFSTMGSDGTLIGNEGAYVIAANKSLKKLNIAGAGIDQRGAKALSELPNLQVLDISSNPLGDEGAQAIAKSISITHLKVVSCNINATGGSAIAANPMLIELYMNQNPIGNGANSFGSHNNLQKLTVFRCGIMNEGAVAIGKIKTLVKLDISNNPLVGDIGISAIATCPLLDDLNIIECALSVKGAAALAKSKRINELRVFNDMIGSEEYRLLLTNKKIRSLFFPLSNVQQDVLLNSISKNFFLLHFSSFSSLPNENDLKSATFYQQLLLNQKIWSILNSNALLTPAIVKTITSLMKEKTGVKTVNFTEAVLPLLNIALGRVRELSNENNFVGKMNLMLSQDLLEVINQQTISQKYTWSFRFYSTGAEKSASDTTAEVVNDIVWSARRVNANKNYD